MGEVDGDGHLKCYLHHCKIEWRVNWEWGMDAGIHSLFDWKLYFPSPIHFMRFIACLAESQEFESSRVTLHFKLNHISARTNLPPNADHRKDMNISESDLSESDHTNTSQKTTNFGNGAGVKEMRWCKE